ncbi:MAG: sulfurtransferase TusA family protein [Armatimonadetes bacterium]|nr:sulfurtransferase TusA family protein [Armatimonadota bacterium]
MISSLDAVGLFCPIPIVKLKQELEVMSSKDVVEMLADDPGILEDIPAWCKETNNKLLSIEKNQEDIFTVYIEKK